MSQSRRAPLPRPGTRAWASLWDEIRERTTPWPAPGFDELRPRPRPRPRRACRGAPLLLTCEHASPAIPAPYRGLGLAAGVLRSHRAWDIGALDVLRPLAAALRAPAVFARWSRLLCDCNRDLPQRSRIAPRMDGQPIPLNRRLPAVERDRRTDLVWHSYHGAVERAGAAVADAHDGRFFVVSIHSFTARIGDDVRGFDIGVLFDEHEDLARDLAARIAAHGLSVRLNQPYSGKRGLIYSAQRHGDAFGVPPLEIEMNQRTLTRSGGRERVTAALVDAIAGLCEDEARRVAGDRRRTARATRARRT